MAKQRCSSHRHQSIFLRFDFPRLDLTVTGFGGVIVRSDSVGELFPDPVGVLQRESLKRLRLAPSITAIRLSPTYGARRLAG